MKNIVLSAHALEQARHRGALESEIVAAIAQQPWEPAKNGRFQTRMTVPYGDDWNGKRYDLKCVRPVFLELEAQAVVVTVHTYYYNEEAAP